MTSLDLGRTQVTGKGLETITALVKLEQLSLWQAKKIDDSAGPVLASFRSLKSLDLSETALGDAGLVKLASLAGLRRLYLAGSRVTDEGVQAFVRSRPECQVFWK